MAISYVSILGELSCRNLLGPAAGAGLGTTFKFRRRDSFPPHAEMNGGGVFRVNPGEWAEDTVMALCSP